MKKTKKTKIEPSAVRESKQDRTRGNCYDCGELLQIGPCGGWHSSMEEFGNTVFTVDICCACGGCTHD